MNEQDEFFARRHAEREAMHTLVRPRVYIAGPMTGLPEYNFPAFHAAAARWRAFGWEVLNPAESFGGATDKPYKEYAAHDVQLIRACDAIAMLPGWDGPNARGSVWERELALLLGLDVYDADVVEVPPKPRTKVETFAEGSKPTNPKDAIGSDKLPLHLWPETASVLGSLALLEGALKYGRSNFRAIGVRASIYIDALRRHIAAWMEGENVAPDSEIDHLGHALACIAIIVDARAAGALTDDRNFPGGYHRLVEEMTPHVKRLKEKYADKAPKHYTINDG